MATTSEMTPIQGSLKEADYLAAQWLHIRPRPVFAIVGIMLLGGALAALYASRSWSFAGVLVILCLSFLYMPFQSRRLFRQYRALSERMTIAVRDDGLYVTTETGEGLVPWSYVIKWRYNDRLLLLYPANTVFYLLPSHLFPSSEAFHDFVALVKSKLGKAT
jgi:hypothetical protein